MKDLKRGDVITANGAREEVLARLEDLVWTRPLNANGSFGHINDVQEIEDLITFGFTKEVL